MIEAQRGFQANGRVISTADQMLQTLVNLGNPLVGAPSGAPSRGGPTMIPLHRLTHPDEPVYVNPDLIAHGRGDAGHGHHDDERVEARRRRERRRGDRRSSATGAPVVARALRGPRGVDRQRAVGRDRRAPSDHPASEVTADRLKQGCAESTALNLKRAGARRADVARAVPAAWPRRAANLNRRIGAHEGDHRYRRSAARSPACCSPC